MAQQSLASRAKRDPTLLKRALADPGLRSRLPSSMLSVAQRRARTVNQQNAALGDITTPLSGSNLTGVAQRITEGAFAPAYANIQRQQDLTGAREQQSSQRAQSIYQQLGDYLQHAMAAQQQAGASSLGAVQGINAQQQQELGAAAQQVQAQQAADARVRGEGLDGGGNAAAAQRMADFGQMSAAQEGTRAGLANTNAQAANALLAGIAGATAQQGGETQGNIHKQAEQVLQDLASKRAGLDSQKAGQYADTVTKLRQSAIDQNITAKGLGLKTDAANASQANADRQYNLAKRRVRDAEKKDAYQRAHPKAPAGDLNGDGKVDAKDVKVRYDITHPDKAKGKDGYLSKSVENTTWAKIDKAKATLIKSTKNGAPVGPDGKPLTSDSAILDALQAGGLGADAAYIALSMYRHQQRTGKPMLSAEAVKRAHKLGIHAGGRPIVGTGAPKKIKSVGAKGFAGTTGGGTAALG